MQKIVLLEYQLVKYFAVQMGYGFRNGKECKVLTTNDSVIRFTMQI